MATAEVRTIPPLWAGDSLSREEFLRRWHAHPEIKRAELIGGVVYMPSPVSIEHANMENNLAGLIFQYRVATPGTDSGNNATAYLLEDCPQADLFLRILPEHGGATRVMRGFLQGAPELLVEVCASSAAYDLHQKFELYQEAGVREYLAIVLYEQEIRWHVLVDGVYQTMPPGPDGVWRSQVFPGLWLAGRQLLAGNLGQVLATLDAGLRSAEHQAFVESLAQRRDGGAGK